MSLTTLLLALAPAIIRARPQPEKSKREVELEALVARREDEIEGLKVELERVLRRNEELVVERDSARRRLDEAYATASIDRRLNGHARPAREAEALAYQGLAAEQYQGLQNQLNAAQYNAQQAMNAQNLAAGLLGAQMADGMLEFCNCVPARHDMFLRG
jgi:regulator of replication initiation timing